MVVFGLDWATQPGKRGYARGIWNGKRLRVEEVRKSIGNGELIEEIELYLGQTVLLAIDSPLGWPIKFREHLCRHKAGLGIKSRVIGGDPKLDALPQMAKTSPK